MTTISETIDEFLKQLENDSCEKTASTYKWGLVSFTEYLGVKSKNEVSTLKMETFVKYPVWLSKKDLKKSSRKTYITALGAFLDWLSQNEYINPSYSEILRFKSAKKQALRKRENLIPKTPSDSELELIRLGAKELGETPVRERNVALIEFLFSTGCRANEVSKLKIGSVDFRTRSAKVLGKGSKERIVFFSEEASVAIMKYLEIRKKDSPDLPLFSRHGLGYGIGERVSSLTNKTIWTVVKDIAKLKGLPSNFSPHSFRHGFGTRMLDKTGDLALVQDLMGHASPSSTRIYAKVAITKLKAEHDKVYG